ncbi:MAG: sulfatase-like hydrolase/transferase [Verrucomicrobia bacterium]|nr:sulfatase-like hydrolase/transferase [Verrucomicrobiota bacterium]
MECWSVGNLNTPPLQDSRLLLPFYSHTAAPQKPNVILVITDDQGYGDLSCHGNPVLKTPNLDQLHRESIRLTDFHVTPMYTPTRGQLMTGRHCLANGAMNVSSGRTLLRRGISTMPEIYAASGYRTGHFGKWHLGDNYPYRPMDRGFQEAVWFPSSHIGSAPDYWNNDYFDDVYNHNGRRRAFRGYCTDVFFGEAIEWMRAQAAARRPFFCYLAPNAPHGPLFVPQKYRELYDLATDPAEQRNVLEQHREVAAKMRAHYDQWWERAGPRINEFSAITVGADAENPVQLSPADWQDRRQRPVEAREARGQSGELHIDSQGRTDPDANLVLRQQRPGIVRRLPRLCAPEVSKPWPLNTEKAR